MDYTLVIPDIIPTVLTILSQELFWLFLSLVAKTTTCFIPISSLQTLRITFLPNVIKLPPQILFGKIGRNHIWVIRSSGWRWCLSRLNTTINSIGCITEQTIPLWLRNGLTRAVCVTRRIEQIERIIIENKSKAIVSIFRRSSLLVPSERNSISWNNHIIQFGRNTIST